MTALQSIIVWVWVGIIFLVIYSAGAVFGGWKAGVELVLAVLFKIGFYVGVGSLLYFTCRAISGH